jgi:hypothetical protein
MSRELAPVALAWLEAIVDPRIALAPSEVEEPARSELDQAGLLEEAAATQARALATDAARARPVEWARAALTQGELLDAFTAHCDGDLDDVEVVERTAASLVARWRSETSRVELRNGFVAVERLVGDDPTLLIGDTEEQRAGLLQRFLDTPDLRTRVAIFDPLRLEKIGIVRSSVFVYFEWFLRDAYGVKVLPSPEFTQGLIDRGVISLGMG